MSASDEITIGQKLDRILSILENDDRTGRKGTVQKVSDLEDKVGILETEDKIYKSRITLLGFFGGGIFTVAFWIFQYFITKK